MKYLYSLKRNSIFLMFLFMTGCQMCSNSTDPANQPVQCQDSEVIDIGNLVTIDDRPMLSTSEAYKDCHASMNLFIYMPYTYRVYKEEGKRLDDKYKFYDIVNELVPEFGTVMGYFPIGNWESVGLEFPTKKYFLSVDQGAKNEIGESCKYHIALWYKESYKNNPVYSLNSKIYTDAQINAMFLNLPEIDLNDEDNPKYFIEVFVPLKYSFQIKYKKYTGVL